MNSSEIIYELVKTIPYGKVTTYGWIASRLNVAPRAVGRALHKNPDPSTIPCHRVVNSMGKIAQNFAFGGAQAQKEKLITEGVRFRDELRVDLAISGWHMS